MKLRTIGVLVVKDLRLFSRNRFFILMTFLGLAFYLGTYMAMPDSVDETLEIAIYAPVRPQILEQMAEEGVGIHVLDSEEGLKSAVAAGEYPAGIVLPADLIPSIGAGRQPVVRVYLAADTPDELRSAFEVLVRELVYYSVGQPLLVEVSEEILGPDMVGMQIPPRDRIVPLFAVLLLVTEMMFLATLISEEIERRTIQALLITPMGMGELFAAKGITGVVLAFGQAALFITVVGGLGRQPAIILVALLLGAVMVTGIGFLMATIGKDMMSVMFGSLPVLIALAIPSLAVGFPDLAAGWVKVIPSYYLTNTVHRAANFGAGWSELWSNLLVLLVFNLAIFWIGVRVLGRKMR